MKIIALYKQPADPAAFDQAYFTIHLPLLDKVPGLQKTAVTRFTRSLSGEAFYLMAEMYFSDKEALKAAMRSPEMASAGENLNSFAEGLPSMLYGEEEPALGPTAGTSVSTAAG
jgi:uncharacterized protein (TIGR02118 family)